VDEDIEDVDEDAGYLGIDASVPVEEDPRGLYYHKTDGKIKDMSKLVASRLVVASRSDVTIAPGPLPPPGG
jgi:hypothetical protein